MSRLKGPLPKKPLFEALAPLLLVWLFTIPAALPLAQPTLTQSADGLLHLYRVMALEQAIGQGAFFPRWLPDLAFGYGFPLFIFYAPLSYYFTAALHLLPGLNAVQAFNLSLMLALFLAGAGAYLFVKSWLGPQAGLLGAVAYVYAPFQLYNAMFRGGLPASWAMALFPFVFWAFSRLLQEQNQTRFVSLWLPGAAFALALALLTHNTLSLLFVPLLGLFLGMAITVRCWSGGSCLAPTAKILLALALGSGMAAFFLIPAILEKEFAQVERVIISPDFDFRFHFVSLGDLLAWLPPANTALRNPDIPLTLGLAQVLLAVLGLIWAAYQLLKQPDTARSPTGAAILTLALFGVVVVSIAIFMMVPVSRPLWERLPLLAYIQFPHRLLGVTALALAGLAGLVTLRLSPHVSPVVISAAIFLIFISTAPLLYPRYAPPLPAAPTMADMFAYERAHGAIGTTSFGEYLPIWVAQIPCDSPLEPMYQQQQTITRLAHSYLPPQVRISAEKYGFNNAEVAVDSDTPVDLIFNTFYFPGWQATIAGAPAVVKPFSERGLTSVSVPAGRHQVQLAFHNTPVRRLANTVSGVALLVTLGLLLGSLVSRHRSLASQNSGLPQPRSSRLTSLQFFLLTAMALGLILGKLLYLDRVDNPLKRTFDGMTVGRAGTSIQLNFGNQINLLGYSLNRQAARPGQVLSLTAFWQAQQPLAADYSALAQLVDDAGHIYAGQDNLHPGTIPTSLWQPWEFVQDQHQIPVPPGTPPGDYFLVTGLYDPQTWTRLPVIDGAAGRWSDVLAIPVTVEPADQPPTLAELEIVWPLEVGYGPELRLLGATPAQETLRPNDFLRVALFWEALVAPEEDYQISLRLLDEQGAVILEQTQQPSHNRYPTSRWSAGERVRDNHALWIPPDLAAGVYRLAVQVQDGQGQGVGPWQTVGNVTK